MIKYTNILHEVVLSSLCFVSSFPDFNTFSSFCKFRPIWRNRSANVPVVGMELQKLSNGNHHHEAAVPMETGYVSRLAVNSWCIECVQVCLKLSVMDFTESHRRKKSSCNTRLMDPRDLSSQTWVWERGSGHVVLHLLWGTGWKWWRREVNYHPQTIINVCLMKCLQYSWPHDFCIMSFHLIMTDSQTDQVA